MARAAEDAVEHALELHDINLDYSRESIKEVDNILALLHRLYSDDGTPEWRPSDADLKMAAMMFGGYIGEVLRREVGGTWQIVEGSPAISTAKGSAFPVDKVFKRMTNGPEDDVAFFFSQALAHLGN
jgi:hypothetical protein